MVPTPVMYTRGRAPDLSARGDLVRARLTIKTQGYGVM
jgi:hypothetical protein